MAQPASQSDIYDAITREVSNRFGIATERISPESRLEDLGIDSLAMIDLLFEFENQLGFEIPTSHTDTISTMGDLIAFIERQVVMSS